MIFIKSGERSYVNCALCGRDEGRLLFIKNGWRIVKCGNCSLVYVNPQPRPEQIDQFYSILYDSVNSPLISRSLTLAWKATLDNIERMGRKGKILDIGCSFGNFLNIARERHWDVKGVEISHQHSKYAREVLKLDVYTGPLHEALFGDEYFDVVTIFHVLEHMLNPSACLSLVHRILKKDGILMISVPNIDSLIFRILGKYWAGISPPGHLFYFSPETLEKMIITKGFKLVEKQTRKGPSGAFFCECIGAFFRILAERIGLLYKTNDLPIRSKANLLVKIYTHLMNSLDRFIELLESPVFSCFHLYDMEIVIYARPREVEIN